MLTESFLASVASSGKQVDHASMKDAGVFFHTLQPSPALKSTLKKSSTRPHCLAVSASHVFAAQADKAAVHVYNRERRQQEAIIPFQERISSLALAGDHDGAAILVAGSEGGRVILWELCTGRQIFSAPSHLQAISCMAVDARGDFLLTASLDSNVQVWSLAEILSFSSSHDESSHSRTRSSIRTLSTHRAAVTSVVVGHGSSHANIAVSASADESCIVWDYHTGTVLHTFLMASVPLCLALDPVDRGFYAGYGNGSIHFVDFYSASSSIHRMYDSSLALTPTQPPPEHRWELPAGTKSAMLCLEVNYDGTTVLTGHENGRIHTWDVSRGRFNMTLVDLSPNEVTNILMLPPTGFPNPPQPSVSLPTVVKPRYESSLITSNLNGTIGNSVPDTYTFAAQFAAIEAASRFSGGSDVLPSTKDPMAIFRTALSHPSFPEAILEEGTLALGPVKGSSRLSNSASSDDVMLLQEELAKIKAKQRIEAENMSQLARELCRLQEREKLREKAKTRREERQAVADEKMREKAMGEVFIESHEEPNGNKLGSGSEGMSGVE